MRYRLGLDLGANSLGWCIVELDEDNAPIRLERLGARLFRDGRNPKDKQSLAVARRLARGMRRRRDRWLKRQRRFLDALIQHGLMPKDTTARKALASLDPYPLRRSALDMALPPHHVGRALFHLNQRRGFRSNRKVDKSDDKESGKIKSALSRMRESLKEQDARTVGEWLASRHDNREAVRARLQGQGAKASYNLYLGRDMIADEFDAIWAAQSALHPETFTAEAGAELREILLHQRPLRPVKPGRCTLEPDDERAPLALPSSQRFRILQELNNLRYSTALGEETALTLEQRQHFATMLEGVLGTARKEKIDSKGKLTFEKIRQVLKLPPGTPINLESDKRDGLKGNATGLALSKKDRFGDHWHELPLATQNSIVEMLLAEESESAVVDWLQSEYGIHEAAALKIANTGLADGHSNLGRRALTRILPELERTVVTYDKAVVVAGYTSHSMLHSGEIFSQLPYYGIPLERHVGFGSGDPKDSDERRYGRIANPTVHIGLNQVRRIVNAVIERYGPPTQIALEVTRELKQSHDQKERIQKEQAKRQTQNEADNAELRQLGLREFGENLLRMKLWRELHVNNPLDRRCPYTGRQISRTQLFSEAVEIEHILPFSKTLDDSIPNKTVAFRDANRYKNNRSPGEAFARSFDGYDWAAIQERAKNMPKNKAWRFAENAMQEFEAEHKDFLARHLNDTAYLSRIAKAYLSHVCFPQDIWVTPGRLTAMLRGKWGLNPKGEKDRSDHRHHAIDAAVIAVTDRGLLQRVATASARERLERERDRIIADEPWDGFRDAVKTALPRIVVSYRPDHGHEAGLHNDTAYGFAEPYVPGKASTVVHRVPLAGIVKPEDIDRIRDVSLRDGLRAFVGDTRDKDFIAKVAEFAALKGVRHVRIVEQLTVIPIQRSTDGAPYKAYKGDGNYCVEIYRDDKGRWRDHIVTSFEAHAIVRQRGGKERLRHRTLAQNGTPLVMRLCQDDAVAIGEGDARRIMRVAQMTTGKVILAEHNEGGDLRMRDRTPEDLFKYLICSGSALKDKKERRVFITELGFVRDPGFKP